MTYPQDRPPTNGPDTQLLIHIVRGPDGTLRRRVRRLPRGQRLSGAAAPWVWRRLQASRPQRDDEPPR